MDCNFEILSFRGIECLQLCIINVINYYGLPYRALLFDTFNMEVQPSNTLTAIDISGGGFAIINDLNIMGLKLCPIVTENFLDILQDEQISVLQLPLKECFWVPDELRFNTKHHVIAVQTKKYGIIIVDPMYSKSFFCLSPAFLDTNIQMIFALQKNEKILPDIDFVIQRAYTHLLHLNLESQYYNLLKQWDDIFDTNKFCNSSLMIQTISTLDRSLGYILSGSRKLYGMFLQYIIDEIELKILQDSINMLNQCSKAWCKARNALHKLYIKNEIHEAQNILIKHFKNLQHYECEIKDVLCNIWKSHLGN